MLRVSGSGGAPCSRSGRSGTTHLPAELEATRARVAELEAPAAAMNGQAAHVPETPSAPPAEGQTGRSW